MFKTSTAVALALALFTVPASAQISGSINNDAPTVSSSVQFKNQAELAVQYTAIHFGKGKWQKMLGATDRHEKFNKFAAGKPIGSITTNSLVSASGKEIPAGEYSMYFTVHEGAGWVLNLKNKKDEAAKLIRWRMVMKDTKSDSTRFKVSVNPGDKAGTASITVAFGAKAIVVPVTVAAPAKKKQ